ncbi:MAG: 3-phosphoshikimate 1-carboxyvinyltransferase [Rickettsiales bacterium]
MIGNKKQNIPRTPKTKDLGAIVTDKNRKKPLISKQIKSFCGECVVAGDKSISHRALMLSSQILGVTRIHGLLEGEDVLRTSAAMSMLGVPIKRESSGIYSVTGVGVSGLSESPDIIDMSNSGTGIRLLMGLVSSYEFTTFFTGDESLRSRPMKRVITPLTQIGASFYSHSGDRLPLALKGAKNPMPIKYESPVASAQVKSAVLLAGLNIAGNMTVIEKQATRDHTENMLRYFGFNVDTQKLDNDSLSITLENSAITKKNKKKISNYEIYVPADPSSAAFLVVAAIICKDSNILVRNVCVNPLRTGLFITLKEMGAKISFENERIIAGEKVADIRVKSSKLHPVDIPPERAPSMIDEYPILAVACSFASGESIMRGLSELRVKESDRLNAIIESLTACGVKAWADGDDLHIVADDSIPNGGVVIKTHFDHRIAMSFLVMGMASKNPITIDDATAIATSFPNFVELCNSLGAAITASGSRPSSVLPIVVAIDGPAASGKGTLARRLAENFNLDYLDTGSLYRAVGMRLVYAKKNPADLEEAIKAAGEITIDDLVNPRLRQEKVGQAASIVSAFSEVRDILLKFQRDFVNSSRNNGKGVILDGRDIGTVVYPMADFKFFVTATMFARAKRRHKELEGQGIEVVFDSVLEDLRQRDERDEQREVAPLRPADDSYIIDSSKLDASEVFQIAKDVVMGEK